MNGSDMMNLIDEYEARLPTYKEFQNYIWGCGQRLINNVGLDKFVFYLNAEEDKYYAEK
ncbi:hypothetical protein IGJ55_001232 [Enterococcus sp. AZ170]|uniref:hypothetical protein n=1 Tax=Enterococcus TaxID=1350 RepID=UPI0012FD1C22|nr:hypothetical protein [Enterococcus ureilyticus]MBM7687968.1 hypothetical protein [Enterococcus ureilyticus]MBO0445824.1 hypothetical protein [Enterococcus ureilyticus]